MSREPDGAEVLDRLRAAAGADVLVAKVARVTRYDAAKRQIDAVPVVKAVYQDEEDQRQTEALPVIPCIPVAFPACIDFPVAVGDFVLLVFSDGSLDKWLSTGAQTVDPGDERQHNLTDAIAIPGLLPFSSPRTMADYQGAALGQALTDYLGTPAGPTTTLLGWLNSALGALVGPPPTAPTLASSTAKVTA